MPQPCSAIIDILDSDDLQSTDDESSSSEDENNAEADNHVQDGNTPEPEVKSLTPPATIPQKRKRGPKPKSAQLVEPEPTTKMLTYIFTITPESEANKPTSKRTMKSATLQLKSNKPWSTLEAQLLAKISALLKPKKLDYDDYQRAMILKRPDPTINIDITEQGADKAEKENAGHEADEGQPKKKKKQEPAILLGNVTKNKYIQELREQWLCEKRTATCIGSHCYVDSDSQEHLALSHERFDCWASAMMKGEEYATLEKPPNHKLFSTDKAVLSPVLQRRKDAAAKNSGSTAAPPVFNITIGKEITDLFRPSHAPNANAADSQAGPASVSALQSPLHRDSTAQKSLTLLPPSHAPGADMPLAEFCLLYDLSPGIFQKLTENDYKTARFLRFLTFPELKEMGFKLGEIAGLRDAVELWSVPRV